MHQPNQLEGQLTAGEAGSLLHLDQVAHRQIMPLNPHRVFSTHLRLCQHGQQLAPMPLQGGANPHAEFAIVVDIHQRAPLAGLVEAEPTDGRDRLAARTPLQHLAIHLEG